MKKLLLKSPAKLNLHLRILKRRKDGYHELVTLFHRISLLDSILIEKTADEFSLSTNIPTLATDETNLITKAYRLLQKEFPKIPRVKVRLTKKIPMGGGLGGGSSNAATFLLGMKRLFNLKISQIKLLRLGKKLGADVPFFLKNVEQALSWGIGDKLQTMPTKNKVWFLLLVTPKGLNTKQVYQRLDWKGQPLSLTKEKAIAKILCSFLEKKRFSEASKVVRNDLERPAFEMMPDIPKVIKILQNAGACFVRMSGSGATVFAMCSRQKEAVALSKKVKNSLFSFRKIICHSF